MMVQKEHRNGHPRPASKLVMPPPVRLICAAGRMGMVRPFQRRQIVHVVVERLERAVPRVAKNGLQASLGLAREQRDAQIHRFLELRRQIRQHGKATGDVKTADADLHAGRAQAACDIHGAWILVGLHSHQGHQAAAAAAGDLPRNALRFDARIRLVEGGDVDDDVVAEHAALVAVQSQAIQHRQSIGRNRGAEPLNDVSVVVVVRRLDQDQGKTLWGLPSGH
jgi:hypothetical protein